MYNYLGELRDLLHTLERAKEKLDLPALYLEKD
jgi:hypothetical protein